METSAYAILAKRGMIIAGAISKDEFVRILDEDPFTKAGVSEYKLIEFTPRFYNECLESIITEPKGGK